MLKFRAAFRTARAPTVSRRCAFARCLSGGTPTAQPRHTFDFGSVAYWDAFHTRKAARPGGADFEWFTAAHEPSSAAWQWLRARVAPAPARVLHVGCGTSVLGAALASALSVEVLNVDASARAVEVMRAQQQLRAPMEAAMMCRYEQMDVTDMVQLATSSFGTVVDKGTFEALGFLPHGAERCPAPEDRQAAMLRECARVLEPGSGRLLQITQEPPEERVDKVLGVLRGWSRSYVAFEGEDGLDDACGFVYFGYEFCAPP